MTSRDQESASHSHMQCKLLARRGSGIPRVGLLLNHRPAGLGPDDWQWDRTGNGEAAR